MTIASVLAMGGNVLSSVLLVLANKRTVTKDGFDFMIVLTGLHFYVSFFFALILLMAGYMTYKPIKNYMSLFRISIASLASIVFMNLNLKHNSVGFYQVSKMLCIPVCLLMESIFGLRKQHFTQEIIASLMLILTGMYLVVDSDVKFYTQTGLFYMTLGVIFTSIAQIWFAPLQRDLNLDSMQLLFHTSPWMAFLALAITPLCEDSTKLYEFEITRGIVLDIILSCCMAFLLNLSNYKVLELTSPLTYQILGHVKTISILLAGILFFDEKPPLRVSIGIVLSVIGMVVYGHERSHHKVVIIEKRGGNNGLGSSSKERKDSHKEGSRVSIKKVANAVKIISRLSGSASHNVEGASPTSSEENSPPSLTSERFPHAASASSAHTASDSANTDGEVLRTVEKKYEASKVTIKKAKATDSQMLALYKKYMFIEHGKCTRPRPTGWTDVVGKTKWDAYNGFSLEAIENKKTKQDIMLQYIAEVDSIIAENEKK